MSIELIMTVAVAVGTPIWLAMEEILHRRRRLAERPVPRRIQQSVRLIPRRTTIPR